MKPIAGPSERESSFVSYAGSIRTADFKARLIEDSQDCIKVLDLEARFVSMNVGGMKLLEICEFGPIVGSSWLEFWQGQDRETAQKAVETAREGGVGRFVGYFATTRTRTPK